MLRNGCHPQIVIGRHMSIVQRGSETARSVSLFPAAPDALPRLWPVTGPGPRPPRPARALWRSSAACITASALTMIAVAAAGPGAAVPRLPHPPAGPPWQLPLHPAAWLVTLLLWAAAIAGGAGVLMGLLAVARGARPSARALLGFAVLAITVLTVLPPAGSTDVLDYAADGRIALLGHSPYVMTPLHLKRLGDPIGQWIPHAWDTNVSIYGPLATAEEQAAAWVSGTSAARLAFWLKLPNSLAFAAVALGLDRMLRSRPDRRLRGHLLWTANPLLLWLIVAAGHIDGLSALASFAGIAVLRVRRHGGAPGVTRALAAGALIGCAAAVKIPYALSGLGVAWGVRSSPRALAAAAAGFLAVSVPAYAAAGSPAIAALLSRGQGMSWYSFYQLFYRPFGYTYFGITRTPPGLVVLASLAFAGLAALAFLRFPRDAGGFPALAPALAVSLAWLLAWPYQRPWYDAMVICLLALYPACRLDWLILIPVAAETFAEMPGVPSRLPPVLDDILAGAGDSLVPCIGLAAAVALAWMCLSGSWGWHLRLRSPGPDHPPSSGSTVTGSFPRRHAA
ncbi:MAG TPA: hypothetical protein VKV80_18985 [Streptosporangiaceae bacterium]|nr:hypothetical protein [Streptosporangiaceae bacterium]